MVDVPGVLGPRTMVVSLQNGLDSEAEIARVVGPDRTLRAVVNYAGGKVADGEFRMAFLTGSNHVGAITPAGAPAARRFARAVTAAGLETDFVEDIRKFEWEKTILNAAMSPLCTLTNLTMRECTESAAMMRLVELLIDEGIAAAKADGYEWGADFREYCLGYLRKAGHHRASMWVDAANRRPTEIAFLNGRIRDVAAQRGVPAPTHFAISTLVEGMERHWASPHQ
jgi:2-dehydropantoate 2-reductase